MDIKIESIIKSQIAHCLYSYGDEPKELMIKLEQLVIEWYCKGVNAGIENERKHGKR